MFWCVLSWQTSGRQVGIQTIATQTRLDRRTVARALETLRAKRLIECRARVGTQHDVGWPLWLAEVSEDESQKARRVTDIRCNVRINHDNTIEWTDELRTHFHAGKVRNHPKQEKPKQLSLVPLRAWHDETGGTWSYEELCERTQHMGGTAPFR